MKRRPSAVVAWFPQAAVGAAILIVGITLVVPQHRDDVLVLALHLFLVLGYAVAAGVSRRVPGGALAITATVGLTQAIWGGGVLTAQLALLVVVYTAARYGRTSVMVLSAASIPFGAAVGLLRLSSVQISDSDTGAGDSLTELLLTRALYWHTETLVVLGAVLLACAWVSGWAVRMRDRAISSEIEGAAARYAAAAADETARLRTAQAELARDVHDVVGHSLAVVLAQAEAARLLDDSERVRQMLGNIVATTRSSLQEVRAVLTDTASAAPGALDDLIAGVAASREVRRENTGTSRPLPPDLQVVAYRVLQEMLTNALRHGVEDRPILIGHHWDRHTLTLTVINDAATTVRSLDGQGIPGILRRLEAVGGTFGFARDGSTVTATSRMPVRVGAGEVVR